MSMQDSAVGSGGDAMVFKTDAEWQAELSEREFEVLRNRGTEAPNTGEYVEHFAEKGHYACRGCLLPLYSFRAKFRSGCGWPAYNECYFSDRLKGSHVAFRKDDSHGRSRLEIICKRCGGHLGHLFVGHKAESEKERHCVNSCSVRYVQGMPGERDGTNVGDGEADTEPVGWDAAWPLSEGPLSACVSESVKAELDDVKFAPQDARNARLEGGAYLAAPDAS